MAIIIVRRTWERANDILAALSCDLCSHWDLHAAPNDIIDIYRERETAWRRYIKNTLAKLWSIFLYLSEFGRATPTMGNYCKILHRERQCRVVRPKIAELPCKIKVRVWRCAYFSCKMYPLLAKRERWRVGWLFYQNFYVWQGHAKAITQVMYKLKL